MILVLPFILGAAALASAGFGVASGVDGISKQQDAKEIGMEAQERHKNARALVEKLLNKTNTTDEVYGQLQISVKLDTIQRFIQFIEQIGQQGSQADKSFLEGLEGALPNQLLEYKATAIEAKNIAFGGAKAVGAAYAAGQGAISLVGLFGSASTGAAISGLSGAAAWNATLAWLGGGSLAAGGGGMALGTLVLGGIAVGPALLLGGFTLGGQGEKALTEAKKYEAKVNTEIAKLKTFGEFLVQIQRRTLELHRLVDNLNHRALENLRTLESRPFDLERDAAQFQQVALCIKALSEIMKTPVLNADGNLNPNTLDMKAKYGSV